MVVAVVTAFAEVARQPGADKALVKDVAGHGNAATGQNVATSLAVQPHDGGIQGAASKVKDEDVLRPAGACGVVVSGGDRLLLEVDFLVAGPEGCLEEAPLGHRVRVGILAEAHRPAQYHLANLPAEQSLRPLPGQAQVDGDEVFQGIVGASNHRAVVL